MAGTLSSHAVHLYETARNGAIRSGQYYKSVGGNITKYFRPITAVFIGVAISHDHLFF